MAVPYFRLEVTDQEIEAVVSVLKSGWLTTAHQTAAFEKEFAAAVGEGVEAVAVNSNTAGMHLALEAVGIKPGDQVIVPVLTFTATAEVVRYLGADPVFVDVDPETLCIDVSKLEYAVTSSTKAIMPVHFAGRSADLASIARVASKHGLRVIEDAAHSFPSSYGGKPIGAHGTSATVFSFYANKTITTGEGGMIVTSDPEIAKRCRTMRLHGIDRDVFSRFTDRSTSWQYDVVAPGFKYNLTDVAAALGRMQLGRAEALRRARQDIAHRYLKELADLPLDLPSQGEAGDVHSWHLFIIRGAPGSGILREQLEAGLQAENIGYSVHYTPLHKLSYWRDRYALTDEQFPVATRQYAAALSLPIFPSMTVAEVDEVIAAVRKTVLSVVK